MIATGAAGVLLLVAGGALFEAHPWYGVAAMVLGFVILLVAVTRATGRSEYPRKRIAYVVPGGFMAVGDGGGGGAAGCGGDGGGCGS